MVIAALTRDPAGQPCTSGELHEVEQGETLWGVVGEHYVCASDSGEWSAPSGRQRARLLREIHRHNEELIGDDPNLIHIGINLCLPASIEVLGQRCRFGDAAPPDAQQPEFEGEPAAALDPESESTTEPGSTLDPEESVPESESVPEPEPKQRPSVGPVGPHDVAIDPPPTRRRIGVEIAGVAHVPLNRAMTQIYSPLGGAELALRVPLGRVLRLRLTGMFAGGRQQTEFNGTPTEQELLRGGAAIGLWGRFAGKQRIRAHAGADLGLLWLDRRLVRRDLPVEQLERQTARSLLGTTGVRLEIGLSSDQRWKFATVMAITHMALRIDHEWTYDPQLTLSGGFIHDF